MGYQPTPPATEVRIVRRVKSLLIALVVLALSAGVAFAAKVMPQAAEGGLERAAEAAGKTVPVATEEEEPAEEAPEAEEEPAEVAPEAEEEPAEEAPEDAADTHGAIVSEAAQGETPEGWTNHGAYVSAVARGLAQPGDPAPAEALENGGRMPNHGTQASAAAKAKAGGAAAQGRGSGRP
jgi:hypothetical protein